MRSRIAGSICLALSSSGDDVSFTERAGLSKLAQPPRGSIASTEKRSEFRRKDLNGLTAVFWDEFMFDPQL
ncbi:hypothetical protein BQ8794_180085 [Mesorhizobium prunaredense]|uniref:Uncharacterized protein n=1 Tax=Mesorhizobium prunaredense TaxID=1631249 RepID=A0A1R3V4C1_9HYPH|nr:hypothetical protein BQ8794_180085 [Mesorhizobium prunaredense]